MDEEGERDWRLREGSEGDGEGDRGRLKRKGLVGLEAWGAVVEENSSGAEAIVRRLGVGHLLTTTFHATYMCEYIHMCVAKEMLLQMGKHK